MYPSFYKTAFAKADEKAFIVASVFQVSTLWVFPGKKESFTGPYEVMLISTFFSGFWFLFCLFV